MMSATIASVNEIGMGEAMAASNRMIMHAMARMRIRVKEKVCFMGKIIHCVDDEKL